MRHVIQLNVAGHGYSTYAGAPREGFKEQPLGIATPSVPSSVIDASAALDATVRHCRDGVSVTMRHDVGRKPVLAYGCFFPAACDEKGRPGLVLVHAVELDGIEALAPTLGAAIESLSDESLVALEASVARVALDPEGLDALLERISAEVVRRSPTVTPPMLTLGAEASDLVAVEHDCRGAAALAWLLFAHAMSPRAQGWVIADVEEDGRTFTRVRGMASAAGRVLRGSELLQGSVREYLQRGIPLLLPEETATQRESQGLTTTLEAPTRPAPVATPPVREALPPDAGARRVSWGAAGVGVALGALTFLGLRGVSAVPPSAGRGCDAGVLVAARGPGCDASAVEAATTAAAGREDAPAAVVDAWVALDAGGDDVLPRDAPRRAEGRRDGMLFPVRDRPRPRIH